MSKDLTTFVYQDDSPNGVIPSYVRGIDIKPDGTKLYTLNNNSGVVTEYTMSTAFDITTLAVSDPLVSKDLSADLGSNPQDLQFSSDGTICILYGGYNFRKYTMSTAWDITTMTLSQSKNPDDGGTLQLESFFVKSDGSEIWVADTTAVGGYSNPIRRYLVPTPWDLSTMTGAEESYFDTAMDDPRGIVVTSDGTFMHVSDKNDYTIYSYEMSTPWDVTTAVLVTGKELYWDEFYNLATILFTGPTTGEEKFYVFDLGNLKVYEYHVPLFKAYSGTVQEAGSSVARTVRLYNRETGALMEELTSSAVDGSFEFSLVEEGIEHYIVVLDDTSDATDYNALIYDRLVGV